MKRIKSFLTVVSLAAVLLAGCSGGTANQNGNQANQPGNQSSNQPNNAQATDQSTSGERYTIEVMEAGWINTGTDASDPFVAYMNDKFNIDFKFTAVPPSELETMLLTRFASGEAPDLIYVWDPAIAKKLYNQGVLLEDWSPYLEQVPSVNSLLSDESRKSVTIDGKMIALPKAPETNYFNFMIREDWLQNLGLSAPATDVELLDTLRKFTNEDPDGNGQNDTWGISSAGSGQNIGELKFLQLMYGPEGFYITEDGQVSHPIVDGNHQKTIDLIRTIVEEELIDPDFYTQGWEQRKPKLYSGKIGVAFYPPSALISETEQGNGNTGSTLNWWADFHAKGSENGGKRMANGLTNGLYVVSAEAAKDEGKLARILEVLDGVTYPNEGYYALRWGVGVDGQELLDVGDGLQAISWDNDNYRKQFQGAFDYGTWIATTRDQVIELRAGTEAGEVVRKGKEMEARLETMEAYTNFSELLNLDPQKMSDLTTLNDEFEIRYILGRETDYAAFRTNWLQSGGQEMLDEATAQFKALGLIP